jgi:ribosome-associated translation inhibitor RaiA
VEIHFHAHHADVSAAMRTRAERDVLKAAERIPRVVEATVRFEQDGALRRVSLSFHAPMQADIVGSAEGRYFGPALALALARVKAQAGKQEKAKPKGRAHQLARARD